MASAEFEGKVAIVTGSASGIGRSILTAFVEQGAKGVIADMDMEWGPQVADEFRTSGRSVIFVPTDVSNSAQVTRLFDETVSARVVFSTCPPDTTIEVLSRHDHHSAERRPV